MPSDHDPNSVIEGLSSIVSPSQVGENYQPPPGVPRYQDISRFKYFQDPPTEETSRLDYFEITYTYQAALQIAKVFGKDVHPIPDAMYQQLPLQQKGSQLFVVVSRSSIKRLADDRIAWPAIQVVIKEIPVVKVICTASFKTKVLEAWQIIFWRNDICNYEKPISRNGGKSPIPFSMVAEFIHKYAQIEKII